MRIEFIAWTVTDQHGNQDGGVVGESCDTVHVCGMHNPGGDPVYFESDFYHLGKWCDDNGCTLATFRSVVDTTNARASA